MQCAAGWHTACSRCQSKLPGKRCHSCDQGGAYVRCPVMDGIVCSARVRCAYHQHGCPSYVPYYEPRDHESVCPHAPCSCTEPGCAFVGSPRSLAGSGNEAATLETRPESRVGVDEWNDEGRCRGRDPGR